MVVTLMHTDPEPGLPRDYVQVGIVHGEGILAYAPDKAPHLVSDGVVTVLDTIQVNAALAGAVDEACTRLWGSTWQGSLVDALGVNRRTAQLDRISRRGLHPDVLYAIGRLATSSDAAGLGEIARALGRYVDRQTMGEPGRALNAATIVSEIVERVRDRRAPQIGKNVAVD